MANTIYALLVGINQYQVAKSLNACVNDANNMKTYLETAAAQSGAKLSLVMLTNEQATREKVLRTFEKQLGQAGKDDVALFYFSGHGGRESAHPAFRHTEKDNTLETLICHDSAYVRGIADKELRYLIHKISTKNPHVVIITDSCHSGDVTRHNDPDYRVKQFFPPAEDKLGSVFAQRSWKEFIFSNELSEAKANASAANLDTVLPQGKHIHIAACKANEQAFEVADTGVLTQALLHVLTKSAGNITYQNLYNRLLALADEKLVGYNDAAIRQTPQIYAFDKNHKSSLSEVPDMLYERFLGGLVKGEPIHANVTYNAVGNYWQIDMGAIHGLPSIGIETIKIDVVNDQTKNTIAKATVKKVFANHAEITINTNSYISTSDTFGAFVSDVLATPLLFTTAGNTAGIALLNSFYSDNRRRLQRSNIFAAQRGNMLNAYRITAQNNRYELTYGNSKLPLARAIEGYTRSAANAMFTYLKHIARWQYVKNFRNNNAASAINPQDITLKVFYQMPDGTLKEVNFNDQNAGAAGYAQIPPQNSTTKQPEGLVKIAITNHAATTPYYCALAYMGQLFDIVTDTFANGSVLILPKTTVYAGIALPNGKRTDTIPLVQENFIKYYNFPESFFGLLLLASTQPLSITGFEQEALPSPKTDTRGETEPITVVERDPPATAQKWTAQYFEVKLPNPYFTAPTP